MANLVIDIGNTLTKIAVFRQDELLRAEHYLDVETGTLTKLIDQYQENKAIISSVKKDTEHWQDELKGKFELKHFNAGMPAGIHNQYKTPQTLGPDRLAAVIGA